MNVGIFILIMLRENKAKADMYILHGSLNHLAPILLCEPRTSPSVHTAVLAALSHCLCNC